MTRYKTKYSDILSSAGSANPIYRLVMGEGRISEIIRFGITGVLATLIQYAFYLLFAEVCHISATASAPLSYICSFVFNFFLSSYFTFNSKPNVKKGLGFICSHLFNMGLQTLLVNLFQPLTGTSWALAPAMLICIPVNYLMVHFVFNSRFFK